MYKTFATRIVGIAPLIMHNGQLADPLNKTAKALKEITGKKPKTDADHEEIARIEFLGSLYMGPDGPVITASMIEAAFTDGAKKSKKGKLAEAGIVAEKYAYLEYDGPRSGEALLADDNFRLAVPVGNRGNKVVRTRPIFRSWEANIEVSFLDDIINESDLLVALRAAGIYVGIGDWRPRHGRFQLAVDMQRLLTVAA